MLPKPKNAFRPVLDEDRDEDGGQGGEEGGSSSAGKVTFKLLSRDTKGRFETRQLLVPETNPMAVKLARAEEELRAEKAKLKEQILQLEALNEGEVCSAN